MHGKQRKNNAKESDMLISFNIVLLLAQVISFSVSLGGIPPVVVDISTGKTEFLIQINLTADKISWDDDAFTQICLIVYFQQHSTNFVHNIFLQ